MKINSVNNNITFKNNNNQDDTIIHSPKDLDYSYHLLKNPNIATNYYLYRVASDFNSTGAKWETNQNLVHQLKQDTIKARMGKKFFLTNNITLSPLEFIIGTSFCLILLTYLALKDFKKFKKDFLPNKIMKTLIPLTMLLFIYTLISNINYILTGKEPLSEAKKKRKYKNALKQINIPDFINKDIKNKTPDMSIQDIKEKINSFKLYNLANKFTLNNKKYKNEDEFIKENKVPLNALYNIKPYLDESTHPSQAEWIMFNLLCAYFEVKYGFVPDDIDIIAIKRKRKEKELNTDVSL